MGCALTGTTYPTQFRRACFFHHDEEVGFELSLQMLAPVLTVSLVTESPQVLVASC